ncbi:hypothetical protein EJ06DRAFT_560638 [Trichodelitschia bisporula]|uniref:Uncharacterized protein n=1 Tax=Trichodelitschia bisporula TaxID=703511 RepID=A0A6G1HHS9_9PEZI|nr:hypothetical protein EJ06DRAFT_560638 [Trichodelitschia bisporula]
MRRKHAATDSGEVPGSLAGSSESEKFHVFLLTLEAEIREVENKIRVAESDISPVDERLAVMLKNVPLPPKTGSGDHPVVPELVKELYRAEGQATMYRETLYTLKGDHASELSQREFRKDQSLAVDPPDHEFLATYLEELAKAYASLEAAQNRAEMLRKQCLEQKIPFRDDRQFHHQEYLIDFATSIEIDLLKQATARSKAMHSKKPFEETLSGYMNIDSRVSSWLASTLRDPGLTFDSFAPPPSERLVESPSLFEESRTPSATSL